MHRTISTIVALLAIFLPADGLAKDIFDYGEDSFISLPHDESFSTSDINTIVQDSNDLIWLGTSHGLYRYDGYNYKHFSHQSEDKQTIPPGPVYSLLATEDGNLWVLTRHSLSVFDPVTEVFNSFTGDRQKSTLHRHDASSNIVADKQGGLWFYGSQGLDYFDRNSREFSHHHQVSIDGHQTKIISLAYNTKDILLVGTDKGLMTFSAGAFHPHPSKSDSDKALLNTEIQTILQAADGKVWLASKQKGVFWIDLDGLCHSADLGSETHGKILAMFQPRDSEIWVSGHSDGIFVLAAETGRLLRINSTNSAIDASLSSNYVNYMMKDRSGLIWLVHNDGQSSINLYDTNNLDRRNLYSSPLESGGINLEKINVILESQSTNIWLAGKGINLFDTTEGQVLNAAPKLALIDQLSRSPNQITALAETPSGKIWILLYNYGIVLYDRNSDDIKVIRQASLQLKQSSLMARQDDGLIWLYGESSPSLVSYNPDTQTHRSYPLDKTGSLKYAKGNSMLIDKNELLWLATEHGLFFLDLNTEEESSRHVEPSTISGINVSRLLLTPDNTLWLATHNRLLRRQNTLWPPQFEAIDDKAKLPGDAEFGRHLQSDRQGLIWGEHGTLDPINLSFRRDHAVAGLRLDESWPGANTITRAGTLLFGTYSGLLMIRPENYKPWTYKPKVSFSHITVNGKSVPQMTNKVTIYSNASRLNFEMTSLDYSAPGLNHYSYRLTGLDQTWITDTAQHRHIQYSGLMPGEYTLNIRGSNRTGQFSTLGTRVEITVLAAWYQTWWFRSIIASLLTLLLLGLYQLRVYQLRSSRLALTLQIREGTRELSRRNETLEKKNQELDNKTHSLEQKQDLLNLNKVTLEQKSTALANTLDELVRTREKLIAQEKMASLGEMVKGLAHEINTPLGISVTAASHLQDQTKYLNRVYENGELTPDKLKKYFNHASETTGVLGTNLTKSAELIRSLKKISVNQSNDELLEINLSECLNQIILSMSPTLKPLGHEVKFNCDHNLTMEAYPGALSQIFTNLIQNSVIHGFSNETAGIINIDIIATAPDIISFRYTDNGHGINDDAIKKIFDPFYTTNRGAGGIGLGLSIVFNLVTKKLAGEIHCESEPDRFTRFTLLLPNNTNAA